MLMIPVMQWIGVEKSGILDMKERKEKEDIQLLYQLTFDLHQTQS